VGRGGGKTLLLKGKKEKLLHSIARGKRSPLSGAREEEESSLFPKGKGKRKEEARSLSSLFAKKGRKKGKGPHLRQGKRKEKIGKKKGEENSSLSTKKGRKGGRVRI